jgi:hypothetical protein
MQIHVAPRMDQASTLGASRHRDCASDQDPWAQTLRLLEILRSRVQQEAGRAIDERPFKAAHVTVTRFRTQAQREAAGCAEIHASVTLVERLSETAVVLRWCSRYGHYGDQVWVCRTARCAGICAITGSRIRRGEVVYRPQARRFVELTNADAMIHPSAFA